MVEKSSEPRENGMVGETAHAENSDPILLMEEARYQSRIFQGTEVFVNYWGYSIF